MVYTITDPEVSGWAGERAYVDAEFIRRHVDDVSLPLYYVAGPSAMVDTVERVLREELHISEEKVKTERFTGY